MFIGLSITSKAQLNQNLPAEDQGINMLAQNANPSNKQNEINLNIGNGNTNSISQLDLNQSSSFEFLKKKKSSKIKPWQYVVGGIAILVIGTFAILAPNGINSRDGVQ